MNLKEYLSITPEISAAIRDGKPVVALESTILSHGMPYPDNLAFAAEVERIVRAEGAVPATMAIIDGVLKVGLTQDELEPVSYTHLWIISFLTMASLAFYAPP